MNIDAIVSSLNAQLAQAASQMAAVTASDVTENPAAMLQMQYAMQQYSTMINYESSVMKAFKDMMAGIIAKL
ncbi:MULTISPECIES: type III secretion system needle filament subunit SctF [unclassified Paludibacterium]|uniref:type III secretion system needle filament subunit SctF n=1 Tax=unclassified Paludibacterium TaxID=2618429 RepID=UPI001C05E242|nr:type III secretion system needle filament subunit SctF [Paludibacterium sp. B53371]BEV73183.1 hypothetical protein THUN1379_26650 [Paludibacterium sp. THUN1379]